MDGLELGNLMEMINGDEELLAELVDDLEREYASDRVILGEAIAAGDPHRVELVAHALTGALATFGATAAKDLAYRLEQRGRDSRLDGAPDLLEQLDEQMETVIAFLSSGEALEAA